MSDLDAAVLAWCQSEGCIFTDERRASLVRFVRSTLASAVAQEREEIAKMMECKCPEIDGMTLHRIGCDCGVTAAAIRSRGAATRRGDV